MCFIWSVLRGRIIWVNLPLRHSFHLSLCFLFAQAAASLFFTSRELTWLFQGFSIISRCWTKYNIEDTIIFKSFYTFCSVLGSKSSYILFYIQTSHFTKFSAIFPPFIANVPNINGSVLDFLCSSVRLNRILKHEGTFLNLFSVWVSQW